MTNKNTKTNMVLDHLMSGRSITQLEAQAEYSLFRLPVIIASLRKQGYYIKCTTKKAVNGTRYGRYSM